RKLLTQMGIEPGRLKLLWASAAEGQIFADEITKFTEEVRALGPLNWNPEKGFSVESHAERPMEVPA
ncbi:MAG: hydrogenase iron-sulfur subunit, partial [Anaerolineales bacterium]